MIIERRFIFVASSFPGLCHRTQRHVRPIQVFLDFGLEKRRGVRPYIRAKQTSFRSAKNVRFATQVEFGHKLTVLSKSSNDVLGSIVSAVVKP